MMQIRNATIDDLENIRQFVKNTPPLDLHTPYTYWVMYSQSNSLWKVAVLNNQIIGFVAGIGSLAQPNAAFMWQIGIDKTLAPRGLAKNLVDEFIISCRELNISKVQLTIDPKNKTSLVFFTKHYGKLNLQKTDSMNFTDTLSQDTISEDIYEFEIN